MSDRNICSHTWALTFLRYKQRSVQNKINTLSLLHANRMGKPGIWLNYRILGILVQICLGSDPYTNPSFLWTAKMEKGDNCYQYYLPGAAWKKYMHLLYTEYLNDLSVQFPTSIDSQITTLLPSNKFDQKNVKKNHIKLFLTFLAWWSATKTKALWGSFAEGFQ